MGMQRVPAGDVALMLSGAWAPQYWHKKYRYQ